MRKNEPFNPSRIRNHNAPTETFRRSLRNSVVPAISLLLASKLVMAAPSFEPQVNVTDALLKAENSKVWKQNPYFDDKDKQYLIAARRSDGAVAIVTRSRSEGDPKTLVFFRYFMKCGTRKQWSLFLPNAAAFNAALAHPDIDDPENRGFPLVEGSSNEMLYETVCGKNL